MDSSIVVWLGQNLWVVNATGLALDGIGFLILAVDLIRAYLPSRAAQLFAQRDLWLKKLRHAHGLKIEPPTQDEIAKWRELRLRRRNVPETLESDEHRAFSVAFTAAERLVVVRDLRRICRMLPRDNLQAAILRDSFEAIGPKPELHDISVAWQLARMAVKESLEPFAIRSRGLVIAGVVLVVGGFLLQFIGTVAAGMLK